MTRESHGRPPAMADDALLAPFRESDAPVLTADEVGDAVRLGPAAVEEGLDRLHREGVLERKSVGGGAVWWLPGHTDTDGSSEPMPGAPREREGGLPRELETEIQALDAPDERERAAVYAACYYLFEEGPADPGTLRAEVFPENAAAYDESDEWWTACVRPALAALSAVTRADGEWRLD